MRSRQSRMISGNAAGTNLRKVTGPTSPFTRLGYNLRRNTRRPTTTFLTVDATDSIHIVLGWFAKTSGTSWYSGSRVGDIPLRIQDGEGILYLLRNCQSLHMSKNRAKNTIHKAVFATLGITKPGNQFINRNTLTLK